MNDASDFSVVLSEAEDIARSVPQPLTSAHVLLAMFTLPNGARALLEQRGVNEDLLIQKLANAPRESPKVVGELVAKARDLAESTNQPEVGCIHLLLAITRLRCLAQEMVAACGVDLPTLRNTALGYFTSGSVPRHLQTVSALQPPLPPTPAPSAPQVSRYASLPPTPPVPGAQPQPRSRTVSQPLPTAPVPLPRQAEERDELEADLEQLSPPAPRVVEPRPAPLPAATRPPATPTPSREVDPKLFPWLAGLARNLTALAARGELDPVIGREREIDEVIDVLGKRRTNNPCLLGEPGVGKTAVVEGVAQALLKLRGALGEKVVLELDMASLVAGTQLRGAFSEKLNALKDEVKKADGRFVVFIDELHTVVGAGSTGEGPQDAANELKAALARGEFPCIGATTHDEWRKFISTDPALERRFTAVLVKEPTVAETTTILEGIAPRYAAHHGLRYAPDALAAAARLAARYVSDRFLPDKAISLVDLAGSRCAREGKEEVAVADVARVVAKLAGIPEERLLLQDGSRLLRLESDLGERVIGHSHAVERIARVVRRNYAGFAAKRPMGSFLFLGPTGVGKTELAKALAEVLFGSEDALVRLDMSELSEAHGVARMVGAPPGYVGYGEGGQLTEPVRRRPSSVVLLDEVEKAHRDVLMLLLQVLDEGRLTDGRGRHIDFTNAVVVLTTNAGAEAFGKGSAPVGFGSASGPGQTERALETAKGRMPPELWNRIDERLVFAPLAREEVRRIARLLLADSAKRLAGEKEIGFSVEDGVVEYLVDHGGYDVALGARPMRQTVQRLVEGPLAERILRGEVVRGSRLRVAVEGDGLAFLPA